MDVGSYCRQVESYLCRRNEGHLIRLVGPAFELVCRWADLDIPLRLVFAAIDRAHSRYHSKGLRRRPLPIEFCEVEVRETYDDWRRAVGVGGLNQTSKVRALESRHSSLPAHIAFVVERWTTWHGSITCPGANERLVMLLSELDKIGSGSGSARGAERQELLRSLDALHLQLTAILREVAGPDLLKSFLEEADKDLKPFRQRLSMEALRKAQHAGADQLLYEHFRLPRVVFG